MGELRRTASWLLCLFLFSLPQFSLSSAGVGLENGMGLVGLAKPRHGRRGSVRASSGEQHRSSFASSPSLFHDFLSLPPEIRPPSTTSGGKPEKPTKPSLKNPFHNTQNSFLMPQKSFLNSNLKPRRGRLTLRGFYYPNIKKNDSGAGEDDSTARPMGLAVTRHPA
jgi:hypothetical protein